MVTVVITIKEKLTNLLDGDFTLLNKLKSLQIALLLEKNRLVHNFLVDVLPQ